MVSGHVFVTDHNGFIVYLRPQEGSSLNPTVWSLKPAAFLVDEVFRTDFQLLLADLFSWENGSMEFKPAPATGLPRENFKLTSIPVKEGYEVIGGIHVIAEPDQDGKGLIEQSLGRVNPRILQWTNDGKVQLQKLGSQNLKPAPVSSSPDLDPQGGLN